MKTVWAFIHFSIFITLFNSVENKKLQKSFEEIFGDGWHLKKEEANLAQIMAQENDQKKSSEKQSNRQMINGKGSAATTKSDGQNEEQNDQQQQKREIICKFRAIKEQIKQMKEENWSANQWNKMDCFLAKKLGTYRGKIYKWIKEMGMGRKQLTEEEKREIVVKFKARKEKIKRNGKKYSKDQWTQIGDVLAKELGTNRKNIYKWIKELGMGQKTMHTNEGKMEIMLKYWEMKRNDPKMSDRKIGKALKISRESLRNWKGQFKEFGIEMDVKSQLIVTDEQKRKIVREFQTIKEIIKQKEWKHSSEQWRKIDQLLAKKLGTNERYIYKWTKELGMGQKTMHTNEQRMALMRKYWEMRRNNPKMSDEKIGKALKISKRTIKRWKAQFGNGREGKDAF